MALDAMLGGMSVPRFREWKSPAIPSQNHSALQTLPHAEADLTRMKRRVGWIPAGGKSEMPWLTEPYDHRGKGREKLQPNSIHCTADPTSVPGVQRQVGNSVHPDQLSVSYSGSIRFPPPSTTAS